MRIKISDVFFYFAFILVIFFDFLTKTQFISNYPFVSSLIIPGFILTTLLLLVSIFLEVKFTKGRLIFIAIFAIFIVILARFSGNYQKIVTLGLLLIAVKSRNLINLLKIHLFEVSTLVVFILICYNFGILPGGYSLRDSTVRYFLGFSYTSYFANFLFHIIITAIFVYKEKLSLIFCILFLLTNYYVYNLTDTKSAYYLSLFAVLVYLISRFLKLDRKLKNQISKISKIIEQISFPVATMFILFLTMLYSTKSFFILRLDELLTHRLMLGAKALQIYPINLFGNKIVWAGFNTGMQYLYVDSSFLNILLNYGIVSILLFSIGYFLLGKKNMYRDYYYTLSFIFLIIHSLFDPQFIEIAYNPFTLFLGLTLLTNKEINEIKL
ncbi:TPA: hypothetical protein U2D20_001487 [Streptococcus suis]|nr:hypothetical protein [Streptococcus suis]